MTTSTESMLTAVCLLGIPAMTPADTPTSVYEQEKAAIQDCGDGGTRSVDECRRTAESIVEQRRNSTAHSLAVLRLLTDESLPVLRKLVHDSPNDDVHWGAVAALAHLGDAQIVAHLTERQAQLKDGGDERSAGSIGHFIWKIEVQQTPATLTAYIAEKPGVRVEERLWAIQRADDLDIPNADLRKAILDHAAKIEVNEHGFRPGLTSIKRIGIELDILTEADLPDVRYHRDISEIVSE